MTDYLQVSTATENKEVAAHLARTAVAARLAGNAHVSGPVASFFWHLGEQGESTEWHITFKTTTDRYPELEAHILREHPWENPEVIAVPIVRGAADFLAWLERSVSPD